MNTTITRTKTQVASLAAKEAKVDSINAFITANKSVFTQNATFSAKWLDTNLDWLVPELAKKHPALKHALLRVSAYTTLNKILAFRGMYIKSSNYYSKFTVLPSVDVKSRVASYSSTSRTQATAGSNLKAGISRSSSVWRSLGSTQIKHLAATL